MLVILTAHPPVVKMDIIADSDSEGRGFESLRVGQLKNPVNRGGMRFTGFLLLM